MYDLTLQILQLLGLGVVIIIVWGLYGLFQYYNRWQLPPRETCPYCNRLLYEKEIGHRMCLSCDIDDTTEVYTSNSGDEENEG